MPVQTGTTPRRHDSERALTVLRGLLGKSVDVQVTDVRRNVNSYARKRFDPLLVHISMLVKQVVIRRTGKTRGPLGWDLADMNSVNYLSRPDAASWAA